MVTKKGSSASPKKVKPLKSLVIKLKDSKTVLSFFKEMLAELKATPSWKNKNHLLFMLGKETLGEAAFKNLELTFTGDPVIVSATKYNNILDKITKEKLTIKEKTDSVFKYPDHTALSELLTNRQLFLNSSEALRSAGIEIVEFGAVIKHSTSVTDKLRIIFSPIIETDYEAFTNGHLTRLQNVLVAKYSVSNELKNSSDFINTGRNTFLSPLPEENITDIKIDDMTVGKYYEERNLILLYFNPINIKPFNIFSTDVPFGIAEIISLIKSVGAKTQKTGGLSEKIFIGTFMTKTKEKLRQKKDSLASKIRDINSYEQSILKKVIEVSREKETIEFLETSIANGGKTLFEEIDKTRQLSFVTDVTTDSGSIEITFKETCLDIPNFNRGDHLENFGKRTFYLGAVKITASPGEFKVFNPDYIADNGDRDLHAHPHAAGNPGSPCLGHSEASTLIYELLATGKISEMAKMLWFWLKTYRNKGAYVKQWRTYDDRLSRGYPMWDEKGTLITLNDAGRIKSGEQNKLERHSEYTANVKRFSAITKPFY